jgi:hypothetical protein
MDSELCGERMAVARKRVQDAEREIIQELKEMSTAESTRGTTRKLDTTYKEMLNTIRDSLSNLATSDDEQYGDEGEEE